ADYIPPIAKRAMDGAPVRLGLVEKDGHRRFRAGGSRGAVGGWVSYIEEVQWDMRMGFIGAVLAWLQDVRVCEVRQDWRCGRWRWSFRWCMGIRTGCRLKVC